MNIRQRSISISASVGLILVTSTVAAAFMLRDHVLIWNEYHRGCFPCTQRLVENQPTKICVDNGAAAYSEAEEGPNRLVRSWYSFGNAEYKREVVTDQGARIFFKWPSESWVGESGEPVAAP